MNSKELLEKVVYELTCVSGLKAFDGGASNLEDRMYGVIVPKEDIIDLDYSGLIASIEEELTKY